MSTRTAPTDLQELFAYHLRARLMLRDVIAAEQEILARIVESLEHLPASEREAMMADCISRAAEGLVYA